MMNRFFIAAAAVLSSGIFAYSYWKEWLGIKWKNQSPNLFPEEEIAPYFHASEEIYMRVMIIFAIIFSIIFIGAVVSVIQKKWGWVFFCFVMSMGTILAVMINGAIK